MRDKETSEQQRERLRQQELKNNLTGNINDSFNRANNGNLVDLVGILGWKGTGILIFESSGGQAPEMITSSAISKKSENTVLQYN